MKQKKSRLCALALGAMFALAPFASCAGGADDPVEEVDPVPVVRECETHRFGKNNPNICRECGAINLNAEMGTVAVHDPSIVAAYVNDRGVVTIDKKGDANPIYFVFGTHLGAAFSFDLENWAPFTPLMYDEGTTERSTMYNLVFKTASTWAGYKNSDDVKGNLWAADVIWNKDMKKWCMYYSVNGDDWLSCDVLLTADSIVGPYSYKGTVVWSGVDEEKKGTDGYEDYIKVTGDEKVAKRYLKDKQYHGDYGVSGIDPNVLYDEDGELWMIYGSWSGGIFMIKLDNKTGLRDYNYDYGYKFSDFSSDGAVWDGGRLLYDPYMGIHIAGGYYVSGEGPYVRYIDGYYYLFMSYGFYDPWGGYNMRVFRSKDIKGPYLDYTGDSAIFGGWQFNYGANTKIGISIMSNYKWDCMSIASLSQGHNSAFVDADGKAYLVYHIKYNDGSYGHNVEVHRLVANEEGWYLPTAFEKSDVDEVVKNLKTADVAGTYGVIIHNGIADYAGQAYNKEQEMVLAADGKVSGALEGTWSVKGEFITIKANKKTYKGTLVKQRMENHGKEVLTFTAMDETELCVWGYQK